MARKKQSTVLKNILPVSAYRRGEGMEIREVDTNFSRKYVSGKSSSTEFPLRNKAGNIFSPFFKLGVSNWKRMRLKECLRPTPWNKAQNLEIERPTEALCSVSKVAADAHILIILEWCAPHNARFEKKVVLNIYCCTPRSQLSQMRGRKYRKFGSCSVRSALFWTDLVWLQARMSKTRM